jgi:citrate lyase beta subunit
MNFPKGAIDRLRQANLALASRYPGEPEARQPVHTVYGGAHLFKSNTVQRIGELSLASLREYAPDFWSFASAMGLPEVEELSRTIYTRVIEKLSREPVEDFRIDFEDGYGNRSDAEEDGHAVQAAVEVVRGASGGTLPAFIGIRIKAFTEEMRARSFRTLDIFIHTLCEHTQGKPPSMIVTLPKITVPEQVETLAVLLEALESELGLPRDSVKVELMVETTQSIFNADGEVALPKLVAAARGRCTGAHFGTYDYTAACSITAAHQQMRHPACDFAKQVMKVSLAGTSVFLSDGATNVMPVGPHRVPKEGPGLTLRQLEENRSAVHRAWRLSYQDIQHSLVGGFYQGWDLHPAQLPARYAALYAFFLQGLDSAGQRLKSFIEKAAQATLLGDVFDDAATGQGLLNFFLRAINCGALNVEETQKITGLRLEELRTRSFAKILAGRRHQEH